tara:strand:- start:503 stop:877 length:375 start_codon:yes stop_codon:yes gene_type:complete
MNELTQNFLLDLATNTPFVAFLVYQYYLMRKDISAQRADYQSLRKESKEEEAALRDRYQKVIEEYSEDRKSLVNSLEKRILSLEKGIKKVFLLLDDLKQIKDQVNQLTIKEEVRAIRDSEKRIH